MSVAAEDLKKDVKIKVRDGRVLRVRGCFMSADGIVVTAKDGQMLVDQNISLRDVMEIVKEGA